MLEYQYTEKRVLGRHGFVDVGVFRCTDCGTVVEVSPTWSDPPESCPRCQPAEGAQLPLCEVAP